MLTSGSRSSDFPSLRDKVYLNTAAEGIPPACVGAALQQYWTDKLAGMDGREAHFAVWAACREVASRLLSLAPDEVAFCSCSSEAYNLLATAIEPGHDDEIVVSDLDFPAGVTPWLRRTDRTTVRLWQSRHGRLDPLELEALLSERTRLVQVSLISFYNGHRIAWQQLVDTVHRVSPSALICVDVTQALGRVEFSCPGADLIISSTHKWTLGIHGGCIVGVPTSSAARVSARAGGWFHLVNAFEPDRFERVVAKTGAASYAVGMPNFAAVYALNASLRYLERIGISAISRHSDPLVGRLDAGLRDLGLEPMCTWEPRHPSGIVAFQHPDAPRLQSALARQHIHVMHHAGRIRLSVHGYNSEEDVGAVLQALRQLI